MRSKNDGNRTQTGFSRCHSRLKQTELPWMYEVSKCAPQEALRDLDVAFKNFFRRVQLKKEGKWRGHPGYPKFKSKKTGQLQSSPQLPML